MSKRVLLPQSMIDALHGADGSNYVQVICSDEQKDDVIKYFIETLDDKVRKLIKEFIERMERIDSHGGWLSSQYDLSDYENIDEMISSIEENDEELLYICDNYEKNTEGVLFEFNDSLDIQSNECMCDSYDDAIFAALRNLKRKYHGINYDSIIFYCWSDTHCGETVFYSDSSSKTKKSIVIDGIIEGIVESFIEELESYPFEVIDVQENCGEFYEELDSSKMLECLEFLAKYENSGKHTKFIEKLLEAGISNGVKIDEISSPIRKLMERKCLTAEHCEQLLEIAGDNVSFKAEILNYSNNLGDKGLFDDKESCESLTFAVAGKLQTFENRDAFTEYVESNGGKVRGSISKKTNYLVNNDRDSESSRNIKAKELGIPVITEDEFIERFGPDRN